MANPGPHFDRSCPAGMVLRSSARAALDPGRIMGGRGCCSEIENMVCMSRVCGNVKFDVLGNPMQCLQISGCVGVVWIFVQWVCAILSLG